MTALQVVNISYITSRADSAERRPLNLQFQPLQHVHFKLTSIAIFDCSWSTCMVVVSVSMMFLAEFSLDLAETGEISDWAFLDLIRFIKQPLPAADGCGFAETGVVVWEIWGVTVDCKNWSRTLYSLLILQLISWQAGCEQGWGAKKNAGICYDVFRRIRMSCDIKSNFSLTNSCQWFWCHLWLVHIVKHIMLSLINTPS